MRCEIFRDCCCNETINISSNEMKFAITLLFLQKINSWRWKSKNRLLEWCYHLLWNNCNMHNVKNKMIDCYYLKNKMQNINQTVKTLIRFCQDILISILCENFIVTKLYSSCYWFSNIFSMYNLFETWSFIFDYKTKTLIASRYWHDYSNQCFINELYLRNVERVMIFDIQICFCCTIQIVFDCLFVTVKRLSRCDIDVTIRINHIVKKIEFVMLLIFKYVFVIWFVDLNLLYDLFANWLYL